MLANTGDSCRIECSQDELARHGAVIRVAAFTNIPFAPVQLFYLD